MDPITETVVWGVVWFFGGSFVSGLIYLLGAGLGVLLAAVTGEDGLVVPGVLVGWIAALSWEVFVIIQVILHIVNLVQLLSGA